MYGKAAGDLLRVLAAPPLTRLRVVILCAVFLAISVTVAGIEFAHTKDFVLPAGPPLGGDYVAFDTAAEAAAQGRAADTYDPATFETLLKAAPPRRERYGLTWQYPPTFFFLILPLAFLPFVAGYAAWTGGSALMYLLTLRQARFDAATLFAVVASPITFQAAITGQNGFVTATLLFVAAYYPSRRPIIAGLAAALLTTKPQLGLLLPIAYLAGGCRHAFMVAAGGAALLAAATTVAFGPEIWPAFLQGVTGASDNLATARLPLFKMATPFAAFRHAGAPAAIAASAALIMAAAAVAATAIVWRRTKDDDLRAMALIALTMFAAPYAFYYELIILAGPCAVLARRALKTGWLPYEQSGLLALALAAIPLPGGNVGHGVPLAAVIAGFTALLMGRRIVVEAPEILERISALRFASAKSSAQSG